MIKRVAVIGMGLMGCPMALNLCKAGIAVTVYNRTRDKCRRAQEAGATVADSVAQAAADSDAIVLMLSDDAAVREIALGPDGVLANAKPGSLVIDSSTVHPGLSRELGRSFAAKGIGFLDAPVTGSRPQAEEGKLFFLIGGPREAYQRAIPLFEAMGRKHLHLGANGSGACAKLCNNLAGFVSLAAFCEAMSIGKSFGLDSEQLFEVISNSGGRSAVSDGKGPKILRGDWNADFALKLASKDMRLATALAKESGQRAPVTERAQQVFGEAEAVHGASDVCALYRWYGEGKAAR